MVYIGSNNGNSVEGAVPSSMWFGKALGGEVGSRSGRMGRMSKGGGGGGGE